VWKILNVHSEFAALTDSRKRDVWRRAAPMGVAFMVIKKESAGRGIDQLRVSCPCASF
jgi:hypothetical protein